MKVKLDENLPSEAAPLFRAAGFDASTAAEQALQGAHDADLYAICRHEYRILVTLDIDFANVLAYPPEGSPGVIVLRLKQQGRTAVVRAVRSVRDHLRREAIEGRLWIVDEHRIRIRE